MLPDFLIKNTNTVLPIANTLPKTKPPVKTKVRLAQIHMHNCNWRTEGWMLKSGTFSLKASAGLTIKNSKPTHWRELE